MIRLIDEIPALDAAATKVKFNMNAGDVNKPAWDALLNETPDWLGMNSYKTKQTNNNLGSAKYLMAFAQYYPYGPDYYIFGGMYSIEVIKPEVEKGPGYRLTLMDEYMDYRKRLIVKLEKPIGRSPYTRKYENLQQSLNPVVYELAPDTKLGAFPGYQNVSLMHNDLQNIFAHNEPTWQRALSEVKGIYVISDTESGKLYVGSASGNTDGVWQRWQAYADLANLSGGNKEFERIKAEDGVDHITDNFRYSLVEIFDKRTIQETIVQRENYWKVVLNTRGQMGMNLN
jgi:hypothetical protein